VAKDSTLEKKIKGIKRHIAVDTLGLLLTVMVTSACVQDRDGAKPLIESVYEKFPFIELIWADGGYAGKLVEWAKDFCAIALTIVKRGTEKGFKVLPRRWVVERTFGWFGRNRRLSKDYERVVPSAEGFVYLASTRLMASRLGNAMTR
jgi:putative transposase